MGDDYSSWVLWSPPALMLIDGIWYLKYIESFESTCRNRGIKKGRAMHRKIVKFIDKAILTGFDRLLIEIRDVDYKNIHAFLLWVKLNRR